MSTAEEPSNGSPPLKLYAAMHKARAKMPIVGKSGFNSYDNYKYSTIEDYVEAIQPHLAENGLIVRNDIVSEEWLDDRTTSKGSAEHVVRIRVKATVIHVESGEWISTTMLGEGQDRGDKAYYKADTGARKYALANLFNLASGDDPEVDSPESSAKKTETRTETRPRTRAKTSVKSNGAKPAIAPAAQNFSPPPRWPDTPVDQLHLYLKTLNTWGAVRVACGLLFGPETPVKNTAELIPLWDEFYQIYSERFEKLTEAQREKVMDVADAVEAAHSTMETVRQGAERF